MLSPLIWGMKHLCNFKGFPFMLEQVCKLYFSEAKFMAFPSCWNRYTVSIFWKPNSSIFFDVLAVKFWDLLFYVHISIVCTLLFLQGRLNFLPNFQKGGVGLVAKRGLTFLTGGGGCNFYVNYVIYVNKLKSEILIDKKYW